MLLCLGLLPEAQAWNKGSEQEVRYGRSLIGIGKRLGTSRIKRSNNTYGSHYFVSFSAIPLKKNTGFYKNTMVSLNTVAYGLTQNLSVAGSLDLVSLIRARSGGPVYSGRMQVCGSVSELVHLGASVTYLNTRVPIGVETPEGVDVPPGFATALGMVTIGNKDNQLTVAAGIMHNGQDLGRGPLLNINGGMRVFANVMFITEHWIFSDPDRSFLAHSYGIRIIGNDLAMDLGLAYDKEYTRKITAVGLPFLSATLNF
ncbi:MAG: hypothetical protein JNM62_06505 [Flavobacteriales bacterium]|nr:hypothetical protein [Flavobacteriales bacterium]